MIAVMLEKCRFPWGHKYHRTEHEKQGISIMKRESAVKKARIITPIEIVMSVIAIGAVLRIRERKTTG